MTEAEYLTERLPGPLLAHLRRVVRLPPAAKARKWRLLAVALARLVPRPDGSDDVGQLIDHVEWAADGLARLDDAWHLVDWQDITRYHEPRTSNLLHLARGLCGMEAYQSAYATGGVVTTTLWGGRPEAGSGRCGELVREVFGNPFRPVAFHPAWRTPTVLALAEPVYAGRSFEQLPILADAVEDAGCDAADLLAHLRGPGPHVRGCWALDLALGKA